MKKRLILLPLAVLALAACGEDPQIWELDPVEGESTIAQVKAGTEGEYYTVRGTVVGNSGNTFAIARNGEGMYCYNFNPAKNEQVEGHPTGSYVEIYAKSEVYTNSTELVGYISGTGDDAAASVKILQTTGETVTPKVITSAEQIANAAGAGLFATVNFVPTSDCTLTDTSTADQYVDGTIEGVTTSVKLEKYIDATARTALLAANPTTFEEKATYSVTGLLTATSSGNCRILVLDSSSWRKTADAQWDNPTGVTVTQAESKTEVEVDGKLTLTATVAPETAKQTVTWSSSDETIATVSDKGVVAGVAIGSATITATSTVDATKSATYAVTVKAASAKELTSAITLTPANLFEGLTGTAYATYNGEHTVSDHVFTTSNVMKNTYTTAKTPVFQFKKNEGSLTCTDCLVKKVTIKLLSTYDAYADGASKNQCLKITIGSSVLTPNDEEAQTNRVDTGVKNGNYEAYEYTFVASTTTAGTLTLNGGSNGACYVESITIE